MPEKEDFVIRIVNRNIMEISEMVKVSFRIPDADLKEIDEQIQAGNYNQRSDFFRKAVKHELHRK